MRDTLRKLTMTRGMQCHATTYWPAGVFVLAAAAIAFGDVRVCLASGHGAPKKAAESAHGEAPAAEQEAADANIGGIKLGEFKIRADYPVEAQKSTVRFVLYAGVSEKKAAEVRHVVEEHQQKIRDQILTTTRLLPLVVFEEPDLATFRRRLLIRLRRVLPELAVDDLHVTDFSLLVKSL